MICKIREKDIETAVKLANKCGFHGWDDDEYRSAIYDENKIYLIYFLGEVLVGSCNVLCSFETVDLCVIMVDETFRHQGVATALLTRAMELSRQKGAERMLLEVRESNDVAIAFYQKMGFEQIAVRKNYYHDSVEDALIMEKVFGISSVFH